MCPRRRWRAIRQVDLIIGGIIGAAILFSIVGVATYDRAVSGTTTFTVSWNPSGITFPPRPSETHTGNGPKDIDYPVLGRNLTDVTLTVTIQGNAAVRPTAVAAQVRVTPINASAQTQTITFPQGQPGPARSTPPFAFVIQPMPNATEASGADANETLRTLDATYGNTKGVGVWKILVTFSGVTTPPVGDAEQFTITITGTATAFSAAVAPKLPQVNR